MEQARPPFEYTLSLIGGKWKMRIMFHLAYAEVLRYGGIKALLPDITHKMLSSQLKELEADGLVVREEYRQIPPKVEYRLTEKGLSLMPVLAEVCRWGREHMPEGSDYRVCDCCKDEVR